MSQSKQDTDDHIPDFLRFLSEELGYPLRKDREVLNFGVYLLDLSAWKLSFSSQSPIVWVPSQDLHELGARELAQGITEVFRITKYETLIPIVLTDGNPEDLRGYLQSAYPSVPVLGDEDQAAIMKSRRPTGEFIDRLSNQLNISVLAPYTTSSPVTGSRFFGREHEIHAILGSPATNYAILGIRRIGKTSLLREVYRQLNEKMRVTAPETIIYLDCGVIDTADDCVREIVRN
jgi:hypothetical protein